MVIVLWRLHWWRKTHFRQCWVCHFFSASCHSSSISNGLTDLHSGLTECKPLGCSYPIFWCSDIHIHIYISARLKNNDKYRRLKIRFTLIMKDHYSFFKIFVFLQTFKLCSGANFSSFETFDISLPIDHRKWASKTLSVFLWLFRFILCTIVFFDHFKIPPGIQLQSHFPILFPCVVSRPSCFVHAGLKAGCHGHREQSVNVAQS